MRLYNYLFFTTRCSEALAFYTQCGLGRVAEEKRRGDRIEHAKFEGPGVAFFASDNTDAEPMRGSAHMLIVDDNAEAARVFGLLADGATITTPLGIQPWGDFYGKLTDRFGVQWMIDCPAQLHSGG